MRGVRVLLAGLVAWLALGARAERMVVVEPYQGNGWAIGEAVPERTELPVAADDWAGVCNLFLRVDAMRVQADRREQAYRAWLDFQEEEDDEEAAPSSEGWRFELVWQGRRYLFDRWGHFVIDRRFVLAEDEALIAHLEAFYLGRMRSSPLGKNTAWVPEEPPKPKAAGVPVFAGFEDERYQKHDAVILKVVTAFNADRAKGVGAAPGAQVTVPELSPALVKALMIEETGGGGPRSRKAWEVDPLQVNVPGDWSEAKKALGLKKPVARNEGSLEGNLRAGVCYLARKGFGVSGQPHAKRPGAYFDSWRTALERYNGRKDALRDGRTYRKAYADRVLRRARNPSRYVPISRDHRSSSKRSSKK